MGGNGVPRSYFANDFFCGNSPGVMRVRMACISWSYDLPDQAPGYRVPVCSCISSPIRLRVGDVGDLGM
jgi:hypothetical protein